MSNNMSHPQSGPLQLVQTGPKEQPRMPSFAIEIVAHASPRWAGAKNAQIAAANNLKLSRDRVRSTRKLIETEFSKALGSMVSVQFKEDITQIDGAFNVQEEARGSKDTLRDARGRLTDNSQKHRRVDVAINLVQRLIGEAGASKKLEYASTSSRFWHVSVDTSAGAAFGLAGQLLTLTLINDLTGQTMQGHVFAGGGGPKASIGTNASVWSDPTGFFTDEPKTFKDFTTTMVRYTTIGVSAFIGYEKAYISFIGFGRGAQSIDVGGFNVGTAGFGASVTAGRLKAGASGAPADFRPIEGSDTTSIAYERFEGGKLSHTVYFETEKSGLTDIEAQYLSSVVQTAVATARSG
jgi:hypothetical protein